MTSEGSQYATSDTAKKPRTIAELLSLATSYFEQQGIDSARLDAEILLASILELERIQLYVNFDRPLEPHEITTYREAVAKRAKRVPIAYITGEKEFMSLAFNVNPAVLIPRPETEVLVEKVLERLQSKSITSDPIRMIDIGTGSGVIPITIAKMYDQIEIDAVDISPDALEVARKNAIKHGVADKINFIQSDLFADVPKENTYHVMVSNPPYIARRDLIGLQPEVRFEPMNALDGGLSGLDFYSRLASAASTYLESGGFGAFEIGWDQGRAIREILVRRGFTDVEICEDYAGKDRVVLFEL